MFLFNKREVFKGWGLKDFCRAREALEAAGIGYRYKVGSNMGAAGARRGYLGLSSDHLNDYTVYVKKQDYEQAQYVLNHMRRSGS